MAMKSILVTWVCVWCGVRSHFVRVKMHATKSAETHGISVLIPDTICHCCEKINKLRYPASHTKFPRNKKKSKVSFFDFFPLFSVTASMNDDTVCLFLCALVTRAITCLVVRFIIIYRERTTHSKKCSKESNNDDVVIFAAPMHIHT